MAPSIWCSARTSAVDGVDRRVRITSPEIVAALPVPLIDRNDVGAALLSGSSYAEPSEALETMRQAMQAEEYASSTEIPLGVVRALLDLGFTAEARTWLVSLAPKLTQDWRYQWFSGVTDLLLDDFEAAQEHFNNVLNILPGEAAPKLALAAVAEMLLQQAALEQARLLDAATTRAAANIDTTPAELVISTDPESLRYQAMVLYRTGVGHQPSHRVLSVWPGQTTSWRRVKWSWRWPRWIRFPNRRAITAWQS